MGTHIYFMNYYHFVANLGDTNICCLSYQYLALGNICCKNISRKKTVNEYITIVALFLTLTIEAITMPFSAECLSYELSIPWNSMQLKC